MADSLYDIIEPILKQAVAESDPHGSPPRLDDPLTSEYLDNITRLSYATLANSEPQILLAEGRTATGALQSLASQCYKGILYSNEELARLSSQIPQLESIITSLHQHAIPDLDSAAVKFSKKYSRSSQNSALARRREILNLAAKSDRISDMLEIPTLLSSSIAAGSASASSQTQAQTPAQTLNRSNVASSATMNESYTSALDLLAHVNRLQGLYPNSRLVRMIAAQATEEMKKMTCNLLASFQSKNVKLAGAVRTVGWLRRISPELAPSWDWHPGSKSESVLDSRASSGPEGALGAVLLLGRLSNLVMYLDALEPLRLLAEQELEAGSSVRSKATSPPPGRRSSSADSQQTEVYLKKYLEIFREQSFTIVSMFKGVFEASSREERDSQSSKTRQASQQEDPFPELPSAFASFPLHLADLLFSTLRVYLPAVRDSTARESICSQVLFCSNSLGRLGADFGLQLASVLDQHGVSDLDGDDSGDEEIEWIDVFRKHKVQVSRLEMLASGVGSAK